MTDRADTFESPVAYGQTLPQAERQRVLIDRPEFAEGVAAFLAHRPPDFTGE